MLPPLEHDHRLLRSPLVVVGRSRSGTRVVAETLRRSGIFMGADVDQEFLDSISWYQRFVVPLLSCAGSPPWADREPPSEWEGFIEERLLDTLARHLPQGRVLPWGWKYPETLFLMSVIKHRLLGARFIHVIRDGRDVALSCGGYFHLTFFSLGNPPGWRPPAIPLALQPAPSAESKPSTPSFREFCLSVTFGNPLAAQWRGLDLTDPRQLVANKFLIQMQSWKHSVESARRLGRALDGAYHEIHYERLCLNPVEESARLFDLLGLELSGQAKAYLGDEIRRDGLGRWQTYRFTPAERRDFANACLHGRALLEELDYDVGGS